MSQGAKRIHPVPRPRGTVVLLDGINAVSLIRSRYGAHYCRIGNTRYHVEKFAWSRGLLFAPIFYDLWNRRHHERSAERLVERIRQLQAERPGEPLHLIGHSGGAAIIAFALERLAAFKSVTSAVLLNAGLSANYDLTLALSSTTHGMLAVSSWLDFFMLGWGTTLLGTMDRRHSPSAGMVGFRRMTDPRLEQWRWAPSAIGRMGWWGWHLSAANVGLIHEVDLWLIHHE